jgi:hypothetical protein
MYTTFWLENLKQRANFEDLCVDGRISEWILVKGNRVGGMDWMHVTQDTVQWRVNMVMSLGVP